MAPVPASDSRTWVLAASRGFSCCRWHQQRGRISKSNSDSIPRGAPGFGGYVLALRLCESSLPWTIQPRLFGCLAARDEGHRRTAGQSPTNPPPPRQRAQPQQTIILEGGRATESGPESVPTSILSLFLALTYTSLIISSLFFSSSSTTPHDEVTDSKAPPSHRKVRAAKRKPLF